MRFRWFWNWWRSRSSCTVITYTREGCHLCEVAWHVLLQEQKRFGFQLSAVDIAGDERLEQLYGTEIPVIEINGTVRFRGRINVVLLRRLLRSLR